MPVFFVHDPARGIVTPLDRKFRLREINAPEATEEIGRIHRRTGDERTPVPAQATRSSSSQQPSSTAEEKDQTETLQVKDIMSRPALCARRHHTLAQAWATMLKYEIHHLAIVDEDMKLCGLLSSNRLLHFLIERTNQGIVDALNEVQLEIFCTETVLSTHPQVSLPDLASALLELGMDGVPVCERGELKGMVTFSDIIKTMLPKSSLSATA